MWTDIGNDLGFRFGLRTGSREWRAALAALRRASGSRDARGWEYLQSFRDRGRWTHEFRHRHHPVKQRAWYLRVLASDGWTPSAEHGTVH